MWVGEDEEGDKDAGESEGKDVEPGEGGHVEMVVEGAGAVENAAMDVAMDAVKGAAMGVVRDGVGDAGKDEEMVGGSYEEVGVGEDGEEGEEAHEDAGEHEKVPVEEAEEVEDQPEEDLVVEASVHR